MQYTLHVGNLLRMAGVPGGKKKVTTCRGKFSNCSTMDATRVVDQLRPGQNHRHFHWPKLQTKVLCSWQPPYPLRHQNTTGIDIRLSSGTACILGISFETWFWLHSTARRAIETQPKTPKAMQTTATAPEKSAWGSLMRKAQISKSMTICGSRGPKQFPKKLLMPCAKPTLMQNSYKMYTRFDVTRGHRNLHCEV